MQTLTYKIGADRRALVNNVQNFQINFDSSKFNWVQARQYESTMRQVFANVQNEDGTPFDLTGCNIWFEGILPDKVHKILDASHGIILDPLNGQFRFDMPKQAFAVAGSYVQAFFRIMKDGDSVTTLEFDLQVLADKVISGLIPADYITPFEDLYGQLEVILTKAGDDAKALLDTWKQNFANAVKTMTDQTTLFATNGQTLINKWKQKFSDAVTAWNTNYADLVAAKNALTEQFAALSKQISDKNLVTTDQIKMETLAGLTLSVDTSGLAINDYPRFKAWGYYNGAGIPQTGDGYFGVKDMFDFDLKVTLQDNGQTVIPYFKTAEVTKTLPEFNPNQITVNNASDRKWVYLVSDIATIGIECLNAKFK
ncbi:phage baseplate upper protein [Lactiplantibacillus pingfangensis]|uniref:phage baseplate upper protein n=1 Tax=Lactiplantibacillus pingfangensis TaxID=2559915 RepID=UPI0010FA0703|nr:phage baseplate upper protein [Lactiplantibacillus pingfangensis]